MYMVYAEMLENEYVILYANTVNKWKDFGFRELCPQIE